MGRYVCTDCNFKFSSDNPKDCPYCGKTKLEREKSASELLDEINKVLRE